MALGTTAFGNVNVPGSAGADDPARHHLWLEQSTLPGSGILGLIGALTAEVIGDAEHK